jgi:ABC-type sugar transport system substrate-binding protein
MSVKRTVALCCLGLLAVSGCRREPSSTKKLAFITNNAADFWTIARKGTEKADAGLADVEVEFRLGDGTAAAQKRILDDLLAKGVDGIAISPVDPANQTAMLNDAAKQAIVFTHDSDAPESKRSSIVCVEPWLNGCLAGELMGKFVPPGSKVAIVAGMLKTEDHRKKSDGFAEAFGRHCHGGKIVSVIEGHEDEDESFQKTFDLLRRFPAVAGIYVNTVNCLPVCRALGARGLAGKVKLITTDLFAEMAPYFQKGTISASIYQQPFRQGQLAVRLMADNLTNKIDFPPSVHLSPGVVMTSNLHIFREMRRSEGKLNESVP